MSFTVYLLRDPSGAPRYVGLTVQTLEKRLRTHLSNTFDSAPVSSWIQSLRQSGEVPSIERLQTLAGLTQRVAAEIVEQAWIAYFLDTGADLLNAKVLRHPTDVCVLEGPMPV